MPKATLTNLTTGERLEFQFNPAQLEESKRTKWVQIAPPGVDEPVVQYTGGEGKTLPVETMFDGWGKNVDTGQQTAMLEQWQKPDQKTGAPPVCLFTCGAFRFQCVVEDTTRRHVLFHSDGRPARTEVSLTLRQYGKAGPQPKVTDEMPATVQTPSPTYRVQQGDTLSEIAYKRYGDPDKWRDIVAVNPGIHPRRLQPGQAITLPA